MSGAERGKSARAIRKGVEAPAGWASLPLRATLQLGLGEVLAVAPDVVVISPHTVLRCAQLTQHAQDVAMLERVAPWVIAPEQVPA